MLRVLLWKIHRSTLQTLNMHDMLLGEPAGIYYGNGAKARWYQHELINNNYIVHSKSRSVIQKYLSLPLTNNAKVESF